MAEVRLDATLYRRDAVEATVRAYAQLAAIELSDDAGAIVAAFADDTDERVIDHFCNHALFETAVRARGEAA